MSGLSVVVPSRTASNLIPCVKAIREAGEKARIIVVDDGLLFQGDPFLFDNSVCIIPGEKPFVFARNVNIGIRAAGDDDVILCNDDALLQTTGGFTAMQRAAQEHPEYGIIGATCNNVGNRNQWRVEGGADSIRDEPRMVCFVCVRIARSTINTVGLLDEEFVGYGFEDDSYCLRIRRAGLKIGIVDGCFVDHGSLVSTYRGQPGMSGDLTQNAEIFRQKWGASNHEL